MKNIKNIRVFTLAATLLLCAFSASAAPDERAGTSASAFLKLGTGAPEAQAMGNAFTALSYGSQALFWNPAGAATSTTREFQLSHQQWFEGVGDSAIAYIQPIGRTILGITGRYLRASGDDFDLRDSEGYVQDYSGDIMKDFVASISLARTFFSVLDLGATARYINEDNAGTKHINAAFDAGAKLRMFSNKFVLGFMGQNLGDKDEVPMALRGGAALNTKYFTISGEVVDYVDDKVRYGVGLAIHIPEELVQVATFDIRVGYYNRDNTGFAEEGDIAEKIGLDTTSKITLGFGFYSSEIFGYGVGLDYAMMPSGALGTAHQLAVRLQF
ncbi:MAG: hypothetical protein LBM71_01105 [Elusimicrobiota bacterium]|jgi:hypothetical protein|nr:hypothetical protein [Elusimicrobiota bacterium]